ncbi:hypothetical protein H310_13174 [Aphanomyces invadans]|uniref:Uncharacterized protein n=1 Tax=Aphanomyces invadans TaxID=157072 RepID=A0A024TEA8_9STRA|nr:hypothetical protein H310_13174 [Aphanomyces invadans]ETV92485.1 hypothetical protein H310_13174 [Aphanomyces invadans]|eukprot:XP_008878792.1 hypothetical protein H310_13174 [Aphanomyces invadans]
MQRVWSDGIPAGDMDEATLLALQAQEVEEMRKAHQLELHLHDVERAVLDKSANNEAAERADLKARHEMEHDALHKQWLQSHYDLEGKKQFEMQHLVAKQRHANNVMREHELLDEDSLKRMQGLEVSLLEGKLARERELRRIQGQVENDMLKTKQCFEETSLESKHEKQRRALRQKQHGSVASAQRNDHAWTRIVDDDNAPAKMVSD